MKGSSILGWLREVYSQRSDQLILKNLQENNSTALPNCSFQPKYAQDSRDNIIVQSVLLLF